MHGSIGLAGWLSPLQRESVDSERILSLKLQTSAPLQQMKDFYQGMLDFPVLEEAAFHDKIRNSKSEIRDKIRMTKI